MSSLTIATFSPQIKWRHGGSTATLRFKYSADFTSSDGQPVLRGLYDEVACTITNGVVTVPEFPLITTNDAQVNRLATCTAQFIDSNSTPRDWLFQNFVIPQSLTPACAIATLFDYNQGSALVRPPTFYLSRDETTALVTSMLASLGFGPATNLDLGIVRLRIAAADPDDPEVYGTNDPLVRDALKLMGIDLDATLAVPADTNVIGFDAASGKYVAQATAVPSLHAASHENGGSDEMSVAGLAGLLADPQIAIAIIENGGPTLLPFGPIADGEFLKRTGSSVVGDTPLGAGDVIGPAGSLDGEIVLFDLTTGKLLKRATQTGLLKAANGVLAAAVAGTDYVSPTGVTVDETGAPLTLTAAHNGKIALVAGDVTVPSGLGAGFNVMLIQIGAGPVAIIESSTTVNNRQGHTTIAGEFGTATLYAYAANTFIFAGDTAT